MQYPPLWRLKPNYHTATGRGVERWSVVEVDCPVDWWPTTIPTLPENLTKVLPVSECIVWWWTVLLLVQDFNTMAVQLRYEPVWRDVQVCVPMDRIFKETRPNNRLPQHPTAYFEVRKFIFQFLKIIWVLPGPEHTAPWSPTVVCGTFTNKDDFSAFWNCVKYPYHPYTCIPSAVYFFFFLLNEDWAVWLQLWVNLHVFLHFRTLYSKLHWSFLCRSLWWPGNGFVDKFALPPSSWSPSSCWFIFYVVCCKEFMLPSQLCLFWGASWRNNIWTSSRTWFIVFPVCRPSCAQTLKTVPCTLV